MAFRNLDIIFWLMPSDFAKKGSYFDFYEVLNELIAKSLF